MTDKPHIPVVGTCPVCGQRVGLLSGSVVGRHWSLNENGQDIPAVHRPVCSGQGSLAVEVEHAPGNKTRKVGK